jgi:hypothetical protein
MKAILQAVSDETLTFGDQVYYVQPQVKKYLSNFAPGQEVDINVKEIDGIPMVTFCKPAGTAVGKGQFNQPQQQYSAPTGYTPQYQTSQQYQVPHTQYQAPPQQFKAPIPKVPQLPISGELKGDLDKLTAAIILAYGLDPNAVNQIAQLLKQ